MKRLISIVLSLGILLAASGCGAPSIEEPGAFYYKQADSGAYTSECVIDSEVRDIAHVREDIGQLLALYLQGPENKKLESPFPRGTAVTKWTLVENTLLLTFGTEFAQLSGVDLTIACGCVAKTLMELYPIQRVNIQAEDSLLNGSRSITITEKNIQLVDDSLSRLVTNVSVYYADAHRRYLVGKEISINTAEENNVIEYLIEQLQNPPKDTKLLSPLPEGTRLLDASIENKICKLNLSAEFDHSAFRNAEAQRLSLLSIVNTLSQLPQIEGVEFYTEGNPVTQYRLLTITGPMRWDERAIGPVRNGLNEFDASMYLSNGSNDYLVCVPTRIRQVAGLSKAEMVIQQLIDYKPMNGFASPIPKNTVVNSVTIDNTICHVDLSNSFLNSPDLVPKAIHSLIASVCALDEISETVITIDGQVPSGEIGSYFKVTKPNPEWIP